MEPGDVIHRVARDDLVANGERESDPEDDAGVLSAAVAAVGESFGEVVAAGDPIFRSVRSLNADRTRARHVAPT